MLIPSADAADEQTINYADIRADSFLAGTGKPITYTIYANGGSEPVKFTASLKDAEGNTAGSVSAAGKTTVDMEGVNLTITAPAAPGMYTLTVVFTFTNLDEETVVTKTAPLKVVTPITLKATIDNSEGGAIVNMEVWFVVDGNRIEGSEKFVDIAAGASESVTYDWVTEDLPNGSHWVMLEGQVGPIPQNAPGLNEKVTFYVGQNSYRTMEIIFVVLFIVMLFILLIVYRKPVKNLGKPKARR
jgi:hypothetical protein